VDRIVARDGVLGNAYLIASLQAFHRGHANAGVQVHPSQDYRIASQAFQSGIQLAIGECVESRFVDHRLVAPWLQRLGRGVPTCSGHALPAILPAPVRQTPIIVAVYGGPDVYHWNLRPAALSQKQGSVRDQGVRGRLKIGRGQIVVLKINQ
jgi:hypothetical protein